MDPGGHRLRPIATAAEVCLRCGSTDPATLAPDCAHPRVARFVDLRPELADLVIRVHRARSYLAHVVAELGAAADLERLAGRALVDEEPDALPPPANVAFLRPRDERVRATSGGEAHATRPLGDLAPSATSESSARQRGTFGDLAIPGDDAPEVAPGSTSQTSAATSRGTGRRRRATSGGEAHATRPLGDLAPSATFGDARAPAPPWGSATSESSARQRGTFGDLAIPGDDAPEVAPGSTSQTSAATSRGTGRRRRATPATQPSLFGASTSQTARPPSKGGRP